jgi:hypothetical protein
MPNLTDSDIERATSTMRSAQESYQREIESRRADLFRRDGTPVYTPQEMQEREKAIREAAAATRNAVLERHGQQADDAIAEAERVITMLDGADPLASLGAEDAARAGVRRAFIEEDARLPTHQLERRIAAVAAAGDKVDALLFSRYLRLRLESTQPGSYDRQALNALLEQLNPLTADPDAAKKRAAAEALKERGRRLRKATWETTREEQVQAEMQRMRASGAFSL